MFLSRNFYLNHSGVSVAMGTQGAPDHQCDAQCDSEKGREEEPVCDSGAHCCDKYAHFDPVELRY